MAPIFTCSFGCQPLPGHWTANIGTPTFVTSGRGDGTAMKLNPSASQQRLQITLGSGTIHVFSGYFLFNSLPVADVDVVAKPVQTGGASDIEFGFIVASGKVGLGKVGTQQQASNEAVVAGRWYRLDVRANVVANPWLVDWQIDGVPQTQVSLAFAATTCTGTALGHNVNTTFDMLWSDPVISSTSGDYPIGEHYCQIFVPVADGTHNTGAAGNFTNAGGTNITDSTTDAWTYLDELAPTLTDRVEQRLNTTGNLYTEHRLGAVSGSLLGGMPTPVLGVEAVGGIAGATATSCAGGIKLRDNLGATDDTIFAGAITSATILFKRKFYAARPAALGAWTTAALQELRMRVGFGTDVTPDVYIGGVFVEAAFGPLVLRRPDHPQNQLLAQ